VAHSAADIIIQDDNFASIVKACKWGRNVYDNIRRFLQFQLTINVVALVIAFIGSAVMWESPLQPIQLLWVNLIMDSLASLALATETPKDDLLKRPPYRKKEYIISSKMVKHILGQSMYQCVILFVVVFAGHNFIPEDMDTSSNIIGEYLQDHPIEKYHDWDLNYVFNGMVKGLDGNPIYEPFYTITPSRHLTFTFNLFVFLQIFNMLTARKINDEFNIFAGAFSNLMFITTWFIIVIGQFFIITFGGWALKVHLNGLTFDQWVICVIVGFTSLIWNALLKMVPDHIWPTLGDEDPKDVLEAEEDYKYLRKLAGINMEQLK